MRNILFLLFFIFYLFGCQKVVDKDQVEKEILALHQQERVFHLEKKAEEFSDYLSENVIMLNRGKVNTPTRAENKERFQNYFNSVEFLEWDDMEEPIIKISEDGSMAYVVVQKIVTAKYEGETGDTIQG